jgi:GR25 family glycosyltransferase involved in LPS biosynthesis
MSLPTNWSDVCSSKAHMMGLSRYAFRREYSAAKLKQIGFTDIEFIDGFDGFEQDINSVLRQHNIQFADHLGPGHKGCSYTHMMAWKKMIDDGAPYRVFFEDDVIGHSDLPKGLGQQFWSLTPKDFDILYLGSMMNPRDPVLADPSVLVVESAAYCLHAYILTLSGAKKLWGLINEHSSKNIELKMLDIQVAMWKLENKIKSYCWNGTCTQKSYPTFDEGLPWQAFSDIILPVKDSGLFWQNMRLGTTIGHSSLQLTIPQYSDEVFITQAVKGDKDISK